MKEQYKQISLLIILIFIHLFILINVQFIAWPEMMSYPYLLNNGYRLYRDIINPYPPLLSYFLLFYFRFLGLSLMSLKLLTYSVIILIDLLLFFIFRKLFNKNFALFSLIIFIFLQSSLEGNGLWFDLFTTPFLLISLSLLNKIFLKIQKKEYDRYIIFLGFVLGLAFLVKQTVGFIFLTLVIFFYFIFDKQKKRFFFLFLLVFSFLIPLVIVSCLVLQIGIFDSYLYWVFLYPFKHIQNKGFQLYPTLKQSVILFFLFVPALFSLAKLKSEKKLLSLFLIFISSLFFILPRFSYLHLQPALPFLSLIIVYFLKEQLAKRRIIIVYTYILVLLLIFSYLLIKNIHKEPRFYDNKTIELSLIIKEKLSGKGQIFFYNVSSEYFVLSGLLPTKPWVDTFPWYLEVKGLQERVIQDLEKEKTQYVVFKEFSSEGDFIPGSYRPKIIDNYIKSYYTKIGDLSSTFKILKRI